MDKIYKLIEFNSFDEFLSEVVHTPSRVEPRLWRGQSVGDWFLSPSLFRENGKEVLETALGICTADNGLQDILNAEALVLFGFYHEWKKTGLSVPHIELFEGFDNKRKFIEGYSAYYYEFDKSPYYDIFNEIESDPKENNIMVRRNRNVEDLAALAQHNGIPTRLVDWTYDVNAALYFAAIGAASKVSIDTLFDRFAIWEFSTLYADFQLSPQNLQPEFLRLVSTPHLTNKRQQSQSGLLMYTNLSLLRDLVAREIGHEKSVCYQSGAFNCAYYYLSQIENAIALSQFDYTLRNHTQLGEKISVVSPLFKYTLPYSELPIVFDYLTSVNANRVRYFPDYGNVYDGLREKNRTKTAIEIIENAKKLIP